MKTGVVFFNGGSYPEFRRAEKIQLLVWRALSLISGGLKRMDCLVRHTVSGQLADNTRTRKTNPGWNCRSGAEMGLHSEDRLL